jgi:hypothetical protein
MTLVRAIPFFLLALSAAAPAAHADRRAFTYAYEYMTMPEGDLELEFYNTRKRATFDADSPRSFESQIEIEYGITNRWDVSLYQVFKQSVDETGAGPLGYSKTKVRTRYRFAERGQWPVDVLAYFEVQKAFDHDAWALEPKLILARDFGKATAALNLIAEYELEREATAAMETETETKLIPAFAFGVTYEASPKLKLGAEWFGEAEKNDMDEYEGSHWAGPALSWAPSSKLWVTSTAGFGLNNRSDDFVFRFIVGLGL